MTEVLEHLQKPVEALEEAYRLLKSGGKLVISMPFLYGVHADPQDFQRWTDEKLKIELEKVGFEVKQIEPMGSLFAVIYDLLHLSTGVAAKNRNSFLNRVIKKVIMPFLRKVFLHLDSWCAYKAQWITTGWFSVSFKIGKHN